jgi:hypothetical protein
MPLGLKVYTSISNSIRLFSTAAAGVLVFNDDVPVFGAPEANFALELGGGFDIRLSQRRALTVGYKFHHISNGGLSRVNPGMDANVLYAGISRSRE